MTSVCIYVHVYISIYNQCMYVMCVMYVFRNVCMYVCMNVCMLQPKDVVNPSLVEWLSNNSSHVSPSISPNGLTPLVTYGS